MTTTQFEKQLADAGITKEQAEYYVLLAKYEKEIDDFRKQFMANPENCGEEPSEREIRAELRQLESKEKKALYIPGKWITISTTSGHETDVDAEFYKLLAKHKNAIDNFAKVFSEKSGEYPSVTDVNIELQRLELEENTTTEKATDPAIQESVPVSEILAPAIKQESESKNKIEAKSKQTTATLTRQTFTFSRELEYFTERELTTQTGYSKGRWLSVILKELLDNALDACETARVEPDITIGICDGDTLYVRDNGSGIPTETITKILDFSTRTTDKQAYRSPSRGAQGNALKTILTIPYVLSGNKISRMVIESQGIRHNIEVTVDAIEGKPKISDTQEEIVKSNGTTIWVNT